jgi:hypothetical protein
LYKLPLHLSYLRESKPSFSASDLKDLRDRTVSSWNLQRNFLLLFASLRSITLAYREAAVSSSNEKQHSLPQRRVRRIINIETSSTHQLGSE